MGAMQVTPTDDLEPSARRLHWNALTHPNIPASTTSLIGRHDEIRQIVDLISRPSVRLVTLTGPGGIGKTRLALEVARILQPGVYFIELASLSGPELVPVAIARALGLEPAPDQSVLGLLAAAIGNRRLLLVLDNFEHLIDAEMVVSALLAGCPNLALLLTSRVRLGVSGEYVRQVEPLSLPEVSGVVNAKTLAGNHAVNLFVDRASAAHAPFRLTHPNASAIPRI